jgi:putative ubiquitin-RnfH superfamily antitoxin RatB of RatAB toxin-antitoxin module
MSQSLWVHYAAPERVYIEEISIQRCSSISKVKEAIQPVFGITCPRSHLTLYQSDGSRTTE